MNMPQLVRDRKVREGSVTTSLSWCGCAGGSEADAAAASMSKSMSKEAVATD